MTHIVDEMVAALERLLAERDAYAALLDRQTAEIHREVAETTARLEELGADSVAFVIARELSKDAVHLGSLWRVLLTESDRGAVLSAATLLDEKLGELLAVHTTDPGRFREHLLEGPRPLGTFSSRIEVARAFGFVPPEMARDLDLIRHIRNEMAHTWEARGLGTGAPFDRSRELQYDPLGEHQDGRRRFLRTVLLIAGLLQEAIDNRSNARRLAALDLGAVRELADSFSASVRAKMEGLRTEPTPENED